MSGRSRSHSSVLLLFALLFSAAGLLQGETIYQKPPQAVLDVLDAPVPPAASMSPARDRLLLIDLVGYPSIADLAQPMLRLAGERINPNTNGPHRPRQITGLTLLTIADGSAMKCNGSRYFM